MYQNNEDWLRRALGVRDVPKHEVEMSPKVVAFVELAEDYLKMLSSKNLREFRFEVLAMGLATLGPPEKLYKLKPKPAEPAEPAVAPEADKKAAD